MTIHELSLITGKTLTLKQRASGDWYATHPFEVKRTVDDPFLTSIHGNGRTPDEAIANYCKWLTEHKQIVVNAYGGNRQVFNIPTEVTP